MSWVGLLRAVVRDGEMLRVGHGQNAGETLRAGVDGDRRIFQQAHEHVARRVDGRVDMRGDQLVRPGG